MTVKLLENIKTGRRFIATPELLKRADMRAVTSGMAAADDGYLSEQNDDEYLNLGGEDDDLIGDGDPVVGQITSGSISNAQDTEDEAGTGSVGGDDLDDEGDASGDDDNETSGGTIDLSKFSDDDLIAFANAEPYKLGANKGWNRSTIESKLSALMGG